MKKPVKKLMLAKETVTLLESTDLTPVAGGSDVTEGCTLSTRGSRQLFTATCY